jgi:N-acetylglucosamine kinase-like BadF-type ATPase
MSRHFLGIDSGSSATKWALVDESGNEIKRGKSISVDGHLYREESRINWAKLLDELIHELPDPIVAIYAGVTGASDYPEENQQIADLIISRFPQSKVHVVMDVALGYRANVSDPHGVYLYAGTGSIAVYKDIHGKHRTVGGWGYLLGDEGAGYWMGISALQEILSELELNTFDSRLGSIIASNGKTPTFNQVKELVYGSPRSEVAALALLV